ncbi:MAG TPA: sulfurase [Thiothrix sp.]|nr:sulfurase [Thiothrix sp.]
MVTWLQYLGFRPQTAQLKAIYIAEAGGQTMQAVNTASARVDQGLVGDRYAMNTGYWHRVESCQVTLISEHDLQQARKREAIPLENGEHRRNLVIAGIKTKTLKHRRFQLGECILAYHKPRPPCGYINQLTGSTMMEALRQNSGICLKVLKSGSFAVGDPLILLAD